MLNRGTLLVSGCLLMSLAGSGCLLKGNAAAGAAAVATGSSSSSSGTVANTGDVATINVSGPSGPAEYVCSPITLSALDDDGNAVTAANDTTYTLDDNSSNGQYWTDSACSHSLSTYTFPAGSSSKTIYFSDSAPEAVTGSVLLNAVAGTTWSTTIVPPQIHSIGLTNGSSGNGANGSIYNGSQSGGPCTEMTLDLLDASGNAIVEHLSGGGSTTFTFTVNSGGGLFYSDNLCSTGHTTSSATFAGGTSHAYVYFGGSSAAVSTTSFTTSVTDSYGTYNQTNSFTISH